MKLTGGEIRRFREIEEIYAISIEDLRERLATYGAEAGVEIPEILKPGAAVPEYLTEGRRRRVAARAAWEAAEVAEAAEAAAP